MTKRLPFVLVGVALSAALMFSPDAFTQTGAAPQPPGTVKLVPKAPIKVEPAEIDLGVCKPHEKRPAKFSLTNTGKTPLKVVSAKPNCKCTDLEDITGKVIQPGETLSFGVSMKMPPAPGAKKAEVYVKFEGFENVPVVPRIKAVIRMAVGAEPDHLVAIVDKKTGVLPTDGVLTVTSGDGKPFRILSSNLQAPTYVDFDPEKDSPRNSYQLKWDISTWSCEGMRWWWVIETDHPECPILPCEVWHDCTASRSDPGINTRGWFVKDRIVNLGALKTGEEQIVDVDLSISKGGAIQTITAVEPISGDLKASLVEFKDLGGGSAVLKFKVAATDKARGIFYTFVTVKSATGDAKLVVVGKAAP
jgi:hypothetical protein